MGEEYECGCCLFEVGAALVAMACSTHGGWVNVVERAKEEADG